MIMRFNAAMGSGCSHCEVEDPITKIASRAGLVKLHLGCTLRRFPNRDTVWFEERHAPFRDHILYRMKQAAENELRRPWR